MENFVGKKSFFIDEFLQGGEGAKEKFKNKVKNKKFKDMEKAKKL